MGIKIIKKRHFITYNSLVNILFISFGIACFIKFFKYVHFLREDIHQYHLKIYSKIKCLLYISPLQFIDYLQ